MSVSISNLHGVLKDQTRRRILTVLKESGPLTYTELLGVLETTHTGRLNYHLKVLGDLITKEETDTSRYKLTEKGEVAFSMLSGFVPARGGMPNSLQLNLASIAKTFAILGSSIYLFDIFIMALGLNSIYWYDILFYIAFGLLASIAMLRTAFKVNASDPPSTGLIVSHGIVMTFIGFFVIEFGLDYLPFEFDENALWNLSLTNPAVVAFVLALAGFIIALSIRSPKFLGVRM